MVKNTYVSAAGVCISHPFVFYETLGSVLSSKLQISWRLHGFPQYVRPRCFLLLKLLPWSLPSMSLPIHHSILYHQRYYKCVVKYFKTGWKLNKWNIRWKNQLKIFNHWFKEEIKYLEPYQVHYFTADSGFKSLRLVARLAPVYCCILVRLAQIYGEVRRWQGPHTHTSRPFTSAQQEARKNKIRIYIPWRNFKGM